MNPEQTEVKKRRRRKKKRKRKRKRNPKQIEVKERRRRKKRKKTQNNQPGEERGKKSQKWSKVAAEYYLWVPYVCLITKLPLSYELWKLKTPQNYRLPNNLFVMDPIIFEL